MDVDSSIACKIAIWFLSLSIGVKIRPACTYSVYVCGRADVCVPESLPQKSVGFRTNRSAGVKRFE